jgi:hypothetical protein
MNSDFGVLTLAFGKPIYVGYAVSLARSLILHNPHVPRAIITDSDHPTIRSLFQIVIPFRAEYGESLRQKLHLDLYSPFEKTLFIDSDCLVVRKLDEPLSPFLDKPFGIPATVWLAQGDGDWTVDTDFILRHFSLEYIYKFNSGTIWFTNQVQARKVFTTAREILGRYKELRFKEGRRHGPSDEPIFSVAMALNGIDGIDDRGKLMRTPIGLQGKISIDVLRGGCHFVKYGEEVTPAICHYTGFMTHPTYRRETLKLKCRFSKQPLLRACSSWLPGSYISLLDST